MPKDPKRNIQRYKLEGGHLNEFEFQKSQSEMADKSELPLTDKIDKPNPTQAKRVAELTAEAHRIVEKRKTRGVVTTGGRQSIAADKRPAKKVAKKSAKKTTTRAGSKKRKNVKSRHQKRTANG